MSKLRNEFDTAEAWLRAAVDGLRPDFEAIGKTLPAAMRCNFGFTSHGSKKTGITGQYYDGGASTDTIPKLIIRCNTDDPAAILEAVVHQCVHAVVGVEEGHGKAFREVALRIGLEPPMRTSKAGKRLSERLHALSAELGPFPECPPEFRDDRRRRQGKARRGSAEDAGKPPAEGGMPCRGYDYCARARPSGCGSACRCCPVDRDPMVLEKPLPDDDGDDREEGAARRRGPR